MDAAVVNLIGAAVLALITGATSIGVALAQSRKTRAEAHADLETAEKALQRQLVIINEQLVACEARDRGRQQTVVAMQERIVVLESKLTNLRAGKPSGWSPLGAAELPGGRNAP